MFNLDGVWESEKKFKVVTGMSLGEAEQVFKDFEVELNRIRKKNAESNVGRKSKLSHQDVFLMLMIFVRHYLTYEFIAILFDVNVSNVKRWVDDAHMALGEVLVKKNFRHLIALDQERLSKTALSDSERSILMALSKL